MSRITDEVNKFCGIYTAIQDCQTKMTPIVTGVVEGCVAHNPTDPVAQASCIDQRIPLAAQTLIIQAYTPGAAAAVQPAPVVQPAPTYSPAPGATYVPPPATGAPVGGAGSNVTAYLNCLSQFQTNPNVVAMCAAFAPGSQGGAAAATGSAAASGAAAPADSNKTNDDVGFIGKVTVSNTLLGPMGGMENAALDDYPNPDILQIGLCAGYGKFGPGLTVEIDICEEIVTARQVKEDTELLQDTDNGFQTSLRGEVGYIQKLWEGGGLGAKCSAGIGILHDLDIDDGSMEEGRPTTYPAEVGAGIVAQLTKKFKLSAEYKKVLPFTGIDESREMKNYDLFLLNLSVALSALIGD